MTTLLVGFDSAWTPAKAGAIVEVLRHADGTYRGLGLPRTVTFRDAELGVRAWQADLAPARTLVLLDQPTVVPNAAGQRPVEHLVASVVSRRYGGVQPANRSKAAMFGPGARVWPFLAAFDGAQDPLDRRGATRVLETYPVLASIALGWTLPDARPTGRLPKYNPGRRVTFDPADWQHVCRRVAEALAGFGLPDLATWAHGVGHQAAPRKALQDQVDACICLIVGLHLAEGKDSLLVGDGRTGYMVVPRHGGLRHELEARCRATERIPGEWVREFAV